MKTTHIIILNALVIVALVTVTLGAGCIGSEPQHSEFKQLDDHLYEVTYYKYDDSAMDNCAAYLQLIPNGFGCSAVSAAGYLSHNYDFFYSDMPGIVMKVPAAENRYASISMGTWILNLTCEDLKDLDPVTSAMLPYTIVDGINEKGLAVAINVVPAVDVGFTDGTKPGAPDVVYACIPRLLLDRCATAAEAVAYMDSVNIYNPEQKFAELHYLIADAKETYLVEIVQNKLRVTHQPYMTNYYLTLDDYTPHSMGIERYNIIKNQYDGIQSFDDLKALMQDLRYTRKYDRSTYPFWYSEYSADRREDGSVLDIYAPKLDYVYAVNKEIDNFEKNKRDLSLDVWRTLHTAIYDIKNPSLTLYANENYNKKYTFTFPVTV